MRSLNRGAATKKKKTTKKLREKAPATRGPPLVIYICATPFVCLSVYGSVCVSNGRRLLKLGGIGECQKDLELFFCFILFLNFFTQR